MEKLRIGVIGTGSIGTDHIRRITEKIHNAEVTAVYNRTPKEGLFSARFEDSYMSLAKADDVDAIMVCTPNHTHEPIMNDIIKIGKPIFCEKPLTNTADGCKRIIDQEMKSSKPFIQVGLMRRFDPDYVNMFNLLRERKDDFGRILMMHSKHRAGLGGIQPPPTGRVGGIKVTGTWEDVSKQQIADGPLHDIDTCRWLLDDPDDYYETAQTIWPLTSRHAKNYQTPSLFVLKTKKGVVVTIEGYFSFHGQYDIQLEVICDDAIINYPQYSQPRIRRDAFDGHAMPLNHLYKFATAFDIELQQWVNGILAGNYVSGASSWDAYLACCASDALGRSIDSKNIEICEFQATPSFYK